MDKKTNQEKYAHYKKNSRYQFCEIPNDDEGKAFVELLRKYLNRERYNIRVKGQYLDKKKYPDTYWSHGAPPDACTHLRVYIDEKPNVRHNAWVAQQTYGVASAITILENKLNSLKGMYKDGV